MNILRSQRKGKLKNTSKRLLAIALAFIMTTFAWFTYVKILDTNLDLHINSWNIKYYLGTGEDKEQISNPVVINFTDELYPGMPNKSKSITVENNGEVYIELDYTFSGVTILGQEYDIISVNDTVETYPEHYVISDEKTINDNLIKQILIKPTDITHAVSSTPEDYDMPLQLTIQCPRIISYSSSDIIKITLSWDGNNDSLDTKFGNMIADFKNQHPEDTNFISFNLNIKSTQIITDTFEDVTDENYGEYVNLNTNLLSKVVKLSDNTYPEEDWRILYKDDDYVYVILSDYLQTYGNSKVSGILQECGLTGGTIDCIYAISASNASSLNSALKDDAWNDLLASSLINNDVYVVGGEDLDFWNNVNNSRTTTQAKVYGKYASKDSLANMLIKNKIMLADVNLLQLSTSNPNYIPHNSILENCEGYWMANSEDSSKFQYIKYNGNILSEESVSNNIGIRPIVRLPLITDVMTEEDNDEIKWDVLVPDSDSLNDKGNTLYSQIDSSNYGDYVDLGTDLGLTQNTLSDGTTPAEDWRILYKDTTEEKVYLIASEYLSNSYNNGLSIGLNTNGTYGWYSEVSEEDLVNRLSDSDKWKCLLNGTKFVDDEDIKAYGSIDIEKYISSLNDKNETKLWTAQTENYMPNTEKYGYYVGEGESIPENYSGSITYFSYSSSNNSTFWNQLSANTLYWPYSLTFNSESGNGFWFKNLSANSGNLMKMQSDSITYQNYSDNKIAIRPVIVLPSDIVAKATINNGVITWNTEYETEIVEREDGSDNLYAQIDSSNYGDYIDLGTNLTLTNTNLSDGTMPLEDWRIFYKDTENEKLYVILSDVLPYSYEAELVTGLLNAGSSYPYNWRSDRKRKFDEWFKDRKYMEKITRRCGLFIL